MQAPKMSPVTLFVNWSTIAILTHACMSSCHCDLGLAWASRPGLLSPVNLCMMAHFSDNNLSGWRVLIRLDSCFSSIHTVEGLYFQLPGPSPRILRALL
ncbi:hypothetical protein EDB82DRAFT_499638 [Fusarium venenatum]|uniref:uncharacterized protein n=1 Tax=Fusarium venenatum TaxID=56646 RepID=UPI001D73D70F|nr:hypothetical protein EDB82DRAFT_499638 [Fusarium venenatum]